MAKWTNQTSYPALSGANVADGDMLPIADVSEASGSQQKTILISALQEALAAGRYDLLLGFTGVPGAGDLDWLLSGRSVTISSADPGEAYARTNPGDGDWTGTIQKNGTSQGTVTISTAGAVTWSIASDITLAAGDRLELVAPDPADSAAADVQVVLRASA